MGALKKHWLFPAIVATVALALTLGSRGAWVQEYHVITVGIFLAFLATGLSLDVSYLNLRDLQLKAAIAALVSSLALVPLLAWALAFWVFPLELTIGVCIIATAPVSIVSGTVMTAIARGNIPLSVFICLLGNSVGIFTIPFSLQLLVGVTADIQLPVLRMLLSLVGTVLLPIVLGVLARPLLRGLMTRHGAAFSVFQQCIVLLIMFNAFSGSGGRLVAAGGVLPAVFLFIVALHSLILALNYGLSRLMRLDRASTSAFTIHTSQKTLTVSYVVWAGSFAAQYPLALIPGIVYHLTQMIMDTFVAERFRRRSPPLE
jgi:sodium/bile acid cotransporter 7